MPYPRRPDPRPETAGDAGAIDDLLRAAFRGEDESVLVRAAGDLACALVAEETGAVVGFVGSSPRQACAALFLGSGRVG